MNASVLRYSLAEGSELIKYPTRTAPFLSDFKHGCRLMRSTCAKGIEATFCQVDQKLLKITFGPMDQKFILRDLKITFGPMDQNGSYFFCFFYKNMVTEIEIIAPPPLAEAFHMK